MKWKKWLENWDMASLKINFKFLEMEWQPSDPDKAAAWEMYIELLTRISTQPLAEQAGDERAALDSVYSLFPTTREIIRRHGRDCGEFTKLAVVVLNQIVRPFTAQWQRLALAGALQDEQQRQQFREELAVLQEQLKKYTGMLANMAGV
ncbi:hypothetical protein [Nitrosospira multiformis]|uniref:Uncharacterized protein n=1 Tax=Nitrosospira multiformis TaxID=1231 RepID=A0A1I7F8I4_9PROT|nr:hypothetical protein [Nitrosospira multiformis]SFU32439.1 hypothetical protein SAMN05216417_101232 [Nitrosospira multiformis]